ncbi:MAG: TrmB family transcriptional regulator sugar-binding domain-containing protein, partial [Nitrosopumilus sp.]
CENDLLKFYHANFLDTLKDQLIDYKILSSTNEKSLYIFDDMDKSKVKRLCSTIKNNLCFLIKDNNEVLFFIKNASNNNREITAMWTNSETMIYSKLLLFKNTWSKSKSIPNTNLVQNECISLE